MELEKLQERIEKKNKDIEKINRRIAKWAKGLRPEDVAVCEPFGNCVYGTPEYQKASDNYREYIKTHKDIPSSDEWSKGPNISELSNAYSDLGEAKNVVAKYQTEIDKLNNFENMEKVEVIWNFLMQWKELAREWYRRNAKRYFELKKGYKEAKQKFLDDFAAEHGVDKYGKPAKPAYWLERNWENNYYFNITALTQEITKLEHEYYYPDPENHWDCEYRLVSYKVDEELLEKALAKEVRAKYTVLINEITHITGEIIDAKGLHIGGKGDINGIVIGEKGKAKVNTFSAGGWNIQCFHYRCKVTKI